MIDKLTDWTDRLQSMRRQRANSDSKLGVIVTPVLIVLVLLILVGIYGFWYMNNHEPTGCIEKFQYAYYLFFIGVVLTGLGSCWYHLNPDNESLVWDRVAMAIMFMSFFSIIVAEHISVDSARKLLLPLVVIGIV